MLKLARSRGWRIVIWDPKKDWQGRAKKRTPLGGTGTQWPKGTVDHPVLVTRFDPKLYVQIFQPATWNAACDEFSKAIMAQGTTILYVDEITQLATANSVPLNFKILLTQGRSINVGVWCGSQRPVNVPEDVKSQSEVWFIFRLTKKGDREVVEGYIPVEETPELIEKSLPYRWFWYYSDEIDKPVLVKPLVIKSVV